MTARRVRAVTWSGNWRPYLYVDRDRHLGIEIWAGWRGHAIVWHIGGRG